MSVEKEIGLILRQARESIGLSLDELQEKTNIQRSFLLAIEEGDFNKLPSPFYVRTYLRNYANNVKIEPHHILRHYRKAEQAERGLTGVHQVVSQQTLTEKLRLNTPVNTGGHNTVANAVKNKQTQRVARTSTHTALTIAKKSPSAKTSGHLQQTNPSVFSRKTKLEDSGQKQKVNSRLDQYSQTKKNSYKPLSRSQTHKEISSTIPPRKSNSSTEVTQSVSQIPSLSRSATMRRGSRDTSFNLFGKHSTKLIIAGVVLLIPLTWGVFSFFSDDEQEVAEPSTQEKQIKQNDSVKSVTTATPDQSTKQVKLVKNEGNTTHYEVSGLDKVEILFKATGESWIQVRKQREIQKKGFLDEAILKAGNQNVYTHDFAKSNDIWITLAIPQSVEISLNGKVIKSAKTIHISKK